MSLLTSFVRYLPLAALAAVPLVGSAACNAQTATVLASDASDASDDSSSGGGGSSGGSSGGPIDGSVDAGNATTDCAMKGGVCVANGTSAPPNRRLATAGQGTCTGTDQCWVPIPVSGSFPACYNNQGCNGDPSVSPADPSVPPELGTCFNGICICHAGFTVQPNGKCYTTPAPLCAAQGGTCRQMPATCQGTELGSASDTDRSCGDFIAAVCCNAKASCTGAAQESAPAGYVPVAFACCDKTAGSHPPICVNGWQTCGPTETPITPPNGICN